ncbi:transglutaminase-like superfamily protein [Moraxella macacae 0408225]|uniref:Transglutaminase-like superfamily protein n=1 Tax=Moraxella macacae 0408225 TaxID=1230338 RepID=L2F998_9GAMM|nr:DUF3488 and transglutaminase-like domain-containing protein [Moraxella macacae]ELA09629.1 transglutaminase-like superfamily protein [Moraxella macacae 0408225]
MKPKIKPKTLFQTNVTQKQGVFAKISALSALHWVLISQLFVVIAHAKHLPMWLVGYALVVIIAQFGVVRHRLPNWLYQPRTMRLLQYIGFLGSLAGLWFTYRTALGLDVAIAFLLLCAISKLLELYTRRDAYVVLSLALFVLAGLFLVEQDLLTTVIVALGVMTTLFAMIGMNDDGTGRYRTLGLLVVQAIPLTVVIFVFFPRLPPLWAVHMSGQNQATTGISDSMSPGDFAKLSQSTELAFRVEFDGEMPRRGDMYWRGLVFSDFDGVTWRPSKQAPDMWYNKKQPIPMWLNETLSHTKLPLQSIPTYRVILEKTGRNWLFALDYPFANQQGIGLTSDFTLRYWTEVYQRLNYKVSYLKNVPIALTLSESERKQYLQLPDNSNQQSREFAKNLYEKVGKNPIAFASALEQWINGQNFHYTLSPPVLRQNRIDEFLFGSRAGFCEHYSSSFAFLMRSVGVPTRIVTGYQGGQLGRDGKSWEVRQMDAHAWVEIWVAGDGWVRIDPTAFVSPDRVEQGMDSLTTSVGAKMFGEGIAGQLSYQQFQLLQNARRLFDEASYYWQRDVVGYDQDKQKKSLFQWFNIQSVYQQVMYMVVAIVILLALLGLWLWYKRRKIWDKTDKYLLDLSKRLAKQDRSLARNDSEGVLHWLQRIQAKAKNPSDIEALHKAYRKARYQPTDDIDKQNKQIKRLTKAVKLIKN